MAVQDALTPEMIEAAASESYGRRREVVKTRRVLNKGPARAVYGLGHMDGVAALTPAIDQLKAELQEALRLNQALRYDLAQAQAERDHLRAQVRS